MLMNATYTVRSNSKRPVNVTVVVRFADREAIYTADHEEGGWFSVSFPAAELGSHLLSVYSDGDQLPNSPFLFAVTLQTCRDSSGRVAGVDGRCVCPSDAVEVLVRCVKYTTLLPAVILPVAAVICAVVLGYVLWLRGPEVVSFWIDPCEVVYSNPEEVIGLGPESKVVRAEFRGAPVAIKIYLNLKSEVSSARKTSRAGSSEGRRTSSRGRFLRRGSSFGSNDGVSPKSQGDLAFSGTNSRTSSGQSKVSVNNRRLSEDSGCVIKVTQSSSLQPGPRRTSTKYLRGMDEAQKAAQAMATTRHPNILTVMGALIHREGRSKAELRLMMELMELGRCACTSWMLEGPFVDHRVGGNHLMTEDL